MECNLVQQFSSFHLQKLFAHVYFLLFQIQLYLYTSTLQTMIWNKVEKSLKLIFTCRTRLDQLMIQKFDTANEETSNSQLTRSVMQGVRLCISSLTTCCSFKHPSELLSCFCCLASSLWVFAVEQRRVRVVTWPIPSEIVQG